MRLLLDTSVLIDHLTQRQPYAQSIRVLCLAAYHGQLELWANAQSYFTALGELQEVADDEDVRNALLGTLKMINVCGVNASDMKLALESDWLAVEDFIAVQSALRVQADFIVTHNAKLFPKNQVMVMNPMELVKSLGLSEEGILTSVASRQAAQAIYELNAEQTAAADAAAEAAHQAAVAEAVAMQAVNGYVRPGYEDFDEEDDEGDFDPFDDDDDDDDDMPIIGRHGAHAGHAKPANSKPAEDEASAEAASNSAEPANPDSEPADKAGNLAPAGMPAGSL